MMGMRKLLVTAIAVGTIGVVAGVAWAAFSGTTANSANSFAVGTVSLTDNDGNAALMSLTNAIPGATSTGCLKVTFGGSLTSTVKLFGTTSGALGDYLTLKVTRGTDSGGSTFPGCGSFTADTRNYIGQGAGVIYNGNLSSFPASYAAGLTDPDNGTGGTETWTTSEAHAYKLEVTLQNNIAAQGQSASASFTWEARNQ